jgi:hypothetical protein
VDNKFDQLTAALAEARSVRYAVQQHARAMGQLLVGNLNHCNDSDLVKLKKELANYNIHTGKWKKK